MFQKGTSGKLKGLQDGKSIVLCELPTCEENQIFYVIPRPYGTYCCHEISYDTLYIPEIERAFEESVK